MHVIVKKDMRNFGLSQEKMLMLGTNTESESMGSCVTLVYLNKKAQLTQREARDSLGI